MDPQDTQRPTRLVIVGGGPRAIGVLERLSASAALPERAEQLARTPLRVHLVDPHMPGAGRIWRAEESPLLLMNSRAADVSIFTDETVDCAGPVVAGPSLAAWAEGIRRGTITAPTAGTARLAEIEALQQTDFASRRVQALYLEWFFGQVLAALPATVSVTLHRTTATAVHPGGGHGVDGSPADGASGATWRVELEDRAALEADLLVLAAGHTDARPTRDRHDCAAFARRHGGAYLPPSQASEAQLELLRPGQDVIVRGMGLAFIDLMALLTEGRGGRFEPDPAPGEPDRLRYLPSGQEPRLWVGSRRGVPYHSKVRDEGVAAGPGDLVHVTAENLAAREDAEGRLDFRTDVLPLISTEAARWVPGVPSLERLDDPLAELVGGADPQTVHDAVVAHVERDLHDRTQGDVSEARALFQLLLRLHGVLVDQLPASRLRGGAASGYPRWWHSLFSFVDSGPPPHRLHQLLALERAGLLRFLGPRLQVEADETTGRFVARSGGVHELPVRVTATALVDAFLPERTLTESMNPLLRRLVTATPADADSARGTASPTGGASIGTESTEAPGALAVDADHRVLSPSGTAQPRLWAVGPWTSELPIGAFARPGTNAPCPRRNDALAQQLLDAATAPVGRRGAEPAAGVGPAGRRSAVSAPAGGRAAAPGGGARAAAGPRPRRLGVLGPGKLGSALARTALRRGVEVAVAGRAPRATLAARLPGAEPVGPAELVAASEIVALTVPLHVALTVDPALLAGAVVLDATNPWGEQDAAAVAAARTALGDVDGVLSTSELLAAHLPSARVVKTLNHVSYHDLEDQGRAPGDPHRRAIAVAADDPVAADAVGELLHHLGYDPVRVGTLADGRELEPGAGLFGTWRSAAELELVRRAQAGAA